MNRILLLPRAHKEHLRRLAGKEADHHKYLSSDDEVSPAEISEFHDKEGKHILLFSGFVLPDLLDVYYFIFLFSILMKHLMFLYS